MMSMAVNRWRSLIPLRKTPDDCPECDEALINLQPDPESPHRLLGVCLDCQTWYLLDEEMSILRVLLLPHEE